jgi:pyridinium-3,5-biscarboxylic acid mononucleotide sulfurtransferase
MHSPGNDGAAPDLAALVALLAGESAVVVAFSGGVDSSVVAAGAARALGGGALAVTARSPALATGELAAAREVAAVIGVRHDVVQTAEMAREGYRANGPDRCYHCKSELYDHLAAVAAAAGGAVVVSGANLDDLGDWRPGLRAATEHGVRHPLVELGLGKARVRALAAHLGLPSAAKPASPCLASRIPYGTPVAPDVLAQVDRAELALRRRGYRELRVRWFGELGRVQLGAADLARSRQPGEHAAIVDAVRAAGFREVRVDDHPFRSGSLNLEIAPR